MKAKRIAALGAIIPLALLCACGGGSSALTLSANWYKNPADQTVITDISETLVYDISFDGSSNTNDLKPDYTGTYTYTLFNTTLAIDEKPVPVYRLHGEATYHVTLTLGEDSLTFEDSVESDVWFRGVADELRPVKSTKTVSETVPLLKSGAKLDECYERHNYTQTVEYDADAKNATLSLKYAQTETDGEEGSTTAGRDYEGTVKLKGSSTLLDNEEILFALRGLDLKSSVTFRTVDFPRRRQSSVSVSVSDPVSEARSFTRNGEAYSATIDIARVTIAYSGSNGGYSQKLEYAGKSNPYNNENRNVLLYSEQTILNGFGLIKYTLRSADFS